MVCSKPQVVMVTLFCGSDGERGQLSSFVWLILSSLLPGYLTNKKTGKKKKRLVFFFPRKETVIMEKERKQQTSDSKQHGKLFHSDKEFLNCWLCLETSTRPVNRDSFQAMNWIFFFVNSADPIIPALNNSPPPFQICLVLFKFVCVYILIVTLFVSFAAWPSPSLPWWKWDC